MKELISEEEWDDLTNSLWLDELRNEVNKRHKKEMERYKALLEVTNEPDVEAWERKMKERAIEFAEFWEAEGEYRESYYLDAEDAYNEKYESDNNYYLDPKDAYNEKYGSDDKKATETT